MRWYQRFFRRGPTEKQLDAELRFHIDQRIADLVAAGIDPEEARRPPASGPQGGSSIYWGS